jgi:hypothetical protein
VRKRSSHQHISPGQGTFVFCWRVARARVVFSERLVAIVAIQGTFVFCWRVAREWFSARGWWRYCAARWHFAARAPRCGTAGRARSLTAHLDSSASPQSAASGPRPFAASASSLDPLRRPLAERQVARRSGARPPRCRAPRCCSRPRPRRAPA